MHAKPFYPLTLICLVPIIINQGGYNSSDIEKNRSVIEIFALQEN